jgi:hypothetical protein
METKEFSKPYSNLRDFRDLTLAKDLRSINFANNYINSMGGLKSFKDLRNLNLEGNEIQ